MFTFSLFFLHFQSISYFVAFQNLVWVVRQRYIPGVIIFVFDVFSHQSNGKQPFFLSEFFFYFVVVQIVAVTMVLAYFRPTTISGCRRWNFLKVNCGRFFFMVSGSSWILNMQSVENQNEITKKKDNEKNAKSVWDCWFTYVICGCLNSKWMKLSTVTTTGHSECIKLD